MSDFDDRIKAMVFTSWVVVEPAEDIPGEWVAHCLSFDVISQGSSPQEALDAMAEALTMTVADDPSEHPAPDEDWERLVDLLERGKRVQMSEVNAMASSRSRVVLAIELKHGVVTVVRMDENGDPRRPL